MSIVLGIDQSLRSTGVFWFSEDRIGWTQVESKSLRGAERLLFIRDAVVKCISNIVPDMVAIEGYSYGSSGKVFQLGELGGVLRVALEEKKIPTLIVSPTQVKKFITGNHQAEKAEVVDAVNKRTGLTFTLKQNDLADAAALAYIAQGYLKPSLLTVRHEAEVITALRKTLSLSDKKPKAKRKHRFHKI